MKSFPSAAEKPCNCLDDGGDPCTDCVSSVQLSVEVSNLNKTFTIPRRERISGISMVIMMI
jgi:hypothetical protein